MIPVHPLLDTASAIERMGDKEIYLEIARYFAENVQVTIENIEQALQNGTMEDATRLAHSLKGNCATIGAETVRAQSATLEQLCRNNEKEQAIALFAIIVPMLHQVQEAISTL